MTHGPPREILDSNPRGELIGGKKLGDPKLREQILERVKPKFHCFGHIHDGHGVKKVDSTCFINAAICTLKMSPEQ